MLKRLLDTGFTDGWLAIETQDLDALQWSAITLQVELTTARGLARFDIYEGKIVIDGMEVIVPVHVGNNLQGNYHWFLLAGYYAVGRRQTKWDTDA